MRIQIHDISNSKCIYVLCIKHIIMRCGVDFFAGLGAFEIPV